jgi:hypothetical protein
MKLSNQNIYNLQGCKNIWGRCQMPLGGGGANHFWGVHTPQKICAWVKGETTEDETTEDETASTLASITYTQAFVTSAE